LLIDVYGEHSPIIGLLGGDAGAAKHENNSEQVAHGTSDSCDCTINKNQSYNPRERHMLIPAALNAISRVGDGQVQPQASMDSDLRRNDDVKASDLG
jgi:hypothetical protein